MTGESASQTYCRSKKAGGRGARPDAENGKSESAAKTFEIFCQTFEDGLAIIDADGAYSYINEPYRQLHKGVDDLLKAGTPYNFVLAEGLSNRIWDLQGASEEEWVAEHALATRTRKRESVLAFADGRWILRRINRHSSGACVEICSDLTKWKQKEDNLNAALKRAAEAEEKSRHALHSEGVRKHEEEVLSQLNHWLHSCKKLPELNSVVESFLARLLPNSHGTLFIYNNSRDVLVPVCSWNDAIPPSEMKADDCWGLRQGRAYHYGRDGWRFCCDHMAPGDVAGRTGDYYCIPILAHGDTAGMLHVRPNESSALPSDISRHWFRLACKCAEQISLAIANVKLSQELKDQSTRDPLTRLFNRRYFAERCSREIGRSIQGGIASSLISIDVDHFKKFNDSFGHDAGDIVLKAFSRVLSDHFRDSDIVCRFGGEEFAVLLPSAPEKVAVMRAKELLPKVRLMKVRYGNETLPSITVSAGVVEFPTAGDCLEDILKAADKALYAAKAQGRDRVVCHGDEAIVELAAE
ncbi:MAG: sensor domain-containing diguanylate cyclase [Alphaproteobacteria bacterium]|nr:sensor domain-containing diguanylate cyclase [Alphaproteobacteria bacterium]